MTDTEAKRAVLPDLRKATSLRTIRKRVRGVSDATVELTSPLRMQPDFLICGAQRCGTTSMFKTLIQHPDVARPFLRKGIHYFDKNYDRGPKWYRGHFPIDATARLRRRGRRPLTGESSPYYMFHPRAATRIAKDLPQVKLIVLLRDPIERAYSAHSHESAKGFETVAFDEAVKRESDRTAGERSKMLTDASYDSFELQHHAYVERGHYIDHVMQLADLVGRDNLLVVDSGDFFATPEAVFATTCRFLGLEVLGEAEGIRFEQHNARQRTRLDPELHVSLSAHYKPFDDRLATWWDHTPSWRRD